MTDAQINIVSVLVLLVIFSVAVSSLVGAIIKWIAHSGSKPPQQNNQSDKDASK